jgi:hypothetical protein
VASKKLSQQEKLFVKWQTQAQVEREAQANFFLRMLMGGAVIVVFGLMFVWKRAA